MTMEQKIATIFGGTGFVGEQVVRELAHAGYRIKVATRVPERAYFLRPCGSVGQVVPFFCDYSDDASIENAVSGADVVVNGIGILYQKKRGGFKRAHVAVPEAIAKACKKQGVSRFVHISALGCDKGKSVYAKTKRDGEQAVKKAFPDVTILRPSVIFGPGDNFFNMFAELSRFLPCLPLIGGGKTLFQPVYVGDVADAVMAALSLPDKGKDGPCGQVYELGGPEILSFKELYQRMFTYTNRPRALVSLPYGLAKIQATFMSLLPKPLLTPDQVESLKTDNIVDKKAKGLRDLGVEPTGMSMILPGYLGVYCPGGRFGEKKSA